MFYVGNPNNLSNIHYAGKGYTPGIPSGEVGATLLGLGKFTLREGGKNLTEKKPLRD